MMQRLIFAITAFCLSFAGVLAGSAASAEAGDSKAAEIAFELTRKGDRIGTHRIAFTREDGALKVAVDIDIKVKFLVFTAFSYEHRVRETWRDGRLVALEATTVQNGEESRIDGRALGDVFEMTAADGSVSRLPADVLATTYWHPRTRSADRLINTQTGEVMDVTVQPADSAVELAAPWGEVDARRFDVSARRDWSLWYDPAGCLMGVSFTGKDGTEISYRLTRHIDPQAADWIAEEPLLSHFATSPTLNRPAHSQQAHRDGPA